MEKLTFKVFLRDLILQVIIFLALTILYYFMKTLPGTNFSNFPSEVLYPLLHVFHILLFGLIYCMLTYYFVFKPLFMKVPLKKVLLSLLLLVAGFFIADFILVNFSMPGQGSYDTVAFESSAARFILFTVFAIPYSFVKGFIWLRMQKLRSEKENIQSALQNLRSQIDPHFIFNSLNNVYGLALEEKAVKTAESIEELSSLFRYTLKDGNVEKISIRQELDFIEKFIHMNKIRIVENELIQVNTKLSWDKIDTDIAPMLLVVFIENAFKYGISTQMKSLININIAVENKKINFMVENTNHKNDDFKNGLGLKNARKRLDFLYYDRYSLSETNDGNMHKVVLIVDLN